MQKLKNMINTNTLLFVYGGFIPSLWSQFKCHLCRGMLSRYQSTSQIWFISSLSLITLYRFIFKFNICLPCQESVSSGQEPCPFYSSLYYSTGEPIFIEESKPFSFHSFLLAESQFSSGIVKFLISRKMGQTCNTMVITEIQWEIQTIFKLFSDVVWSCSSHIATMRAEQ